MHTIEVNSRAELCDRGNHGSVCVFSARRCARFQESHDTLSESWRRACS